MTNSEELEFVSLQTTLVRPHDRDIRFWDKFRQILKRKKKYRPSELSKDGGLYNGQNYGTVAPQAFLSHEVPASVSETRHKPPKSMWPHNTVAKVSRRVNRIVSKIPQAFRFEHCNSKGRTDDMETPKRVAPTAELDQQSPSNKSSASSKMRKNVFGSEIGSGLFCKTKSSTFSMEVWQWVQKVRGGEKRAERPKYAPDDSESERSEIHLPNLKDYAAAGYTNYECSSGTSCGLRDGINSFLPASSEDSLGRFNSEQSVTEAAMNSPLGTIVSKTALSSSPMASHKKERSSRIFDLPLEHSDCTTVSLRRVDYLNDYSSMTERHEELEPEFSGQKWDNIGLRGDTNSFVGKSAHSMPQKLAGGEGMTKTVLHIHNHEEDTQRASKPSFLPEKVTCSDFSRGGFSWPYSKMANRNKVSGNGETLEPRLSSGYMWASPKSSANIKGTQNSPTSYEKSKQGTEISEPFFGILESPLENNETEQEVSFLGDAVSKFSQGFMKELKLVKHFLSKAKTPGQSSCDGASPHNLEKSGIKSHESKDRVSSPILCINSEIENWDKPEKGYVALGTLWEALTLHEDSFWGLVLKDFARDCDLHFIVKAKRSVKRMPKVKGVDKKRANITDFQKDPTGQERSRDSIFNITSPSNNLKESSTMATGKGNFKEIFMVQDDTHTFPNCFVMHDTLHPSDVNHSQRFRKHLETWIKKCEEGTKNLKKRKYKPQELQPLVELFENAFEYLDRYFIQISKAQSINYNNYMAQVRNLVTSACDFLEGIGALFASLVNFISEAEYSKNSLTEAARRAKNLLRSIANSGDSVQYIGKTVEKLMNADTDAEHTRMMIEHAKTGVNGLERLVQALQMLLSNYVSLEKERTWVCETSGHSRYLLALQSNVWTEERCTMIGHKQFCESLQNATQNLKVVQKELELRSSMILEKVSMLQFESEDVDSPHTFLCSGTGLGSGGRKHLLDKIVAEISDRTTKCPQVSDNGHRASFTNLLKNAHGPDNLQWLSNTSGPCNTQVASNKVLLNKETVLNTHFSEDTKLSSHILVPELAFLVNDKILTLNQHSKDNQSSGNSSAPHSIDSGSEAPDTVEFKEGTDKGILGSNSHNESGETFDIPLWMSSEGVLKTRQKIIPVRNIQKAKPSKSGDVPRFPLGTQLAIYSELKQAHKKDKEETYNVPLWMHFPCTTSKTDSDFESETKFSRERGFIQRKATEQDDTSTKKNTFMKKDFSLMYDTHPQLAKKVAGINLKPSKVQSDQSDGACMKSSRDTEMKCYHNLTQVCQTETNNVVGAVNNRDLSCKTSTRHKTSEFLDRLKSEYEQTIKLSGGKSLKSNIFKMQPDPAKLETPKQVITKGLPPVQMIFQETLRTVSFSCMSPFVHYIQLPHSSDDRNVSNDSWPTLSDRSFSTELEYNLNEEVIRVIPRRPRLQESRKMLQTSFPEQLQRVSKTPKIN